jgi:CobQ-like glutamine amidotransferase family enzyme
MKLLRLYDDLLDLYGDSGNFAVVKKRLEAAGYELTAECRTVGEPFDLTQYDFVYISPGLPKNLAVAAADLVPRSENLFEAIEKGVVFLATGNAPALFSEEFVLDDGEKVKGCGLFPVKHNFGKKITIRDLVGITDSGLQITGFLNSTDTREGGYETPFVRITGSGKQTYDKTNDGARKKNLFATELLGPVLVRNPELLRELLNLIAGEPLPPYDDSLEVEAAKRILKELSAS